MVEERKVVTVRIFVPCDPGFPGSGGGLPIDIFLLKVLDFINFFRPLKRRREKKEMQQYTEEFRRENLEQGKNEDGSAYHEFPADMKFGDVLRSLGYTGWDWRDPRHWSDWDRKYQAIAQKNLGNLTEEEIEKSIEWAIISDW